MAFDNQNKLQLSKQNRLDRDDLEKRGQTFSPGPHNINDLAISGSIENLPTSAEIEMITTIGDKEMDKSPCIIQNPYACVQSKLIAFPQVLHEMLETAKENVHDNVISWQHHGRSFRVKDKKTFVATIIRQYFNQTRYTSFQRQLALYGFVRLTKKDSEDFGSYYHKQFLRGHPELACMIQRTGVKGSGQQKVFSTETEPDFQGMESVGIESGVIVDNIPNVTTSTQIDSQTKEEVMSAGQLNSPKKIQWNDPTKRIVASSKIICLTTDDREVNTKRESLRSLHFQTQFQLPNKNSLYNDDRKKRGQPKRSLSLSYNCNKLAITSSIDNQLNFAAIENLTPINATASIIQTSLASVQSKNIAFPQVLHAMLQTAKENGYDNIISWQHHGRSFRVEDKKAFVMTIIPRYFNQTRYSSFRRQLLLYGFVRSAKKTSKDYGAYYHERFLRDHPNLACLIQRTGATGPHRLLLPATEPNYQAMEVDEVYGMVVVDDTSKQTSVPKQITSCIRHPSHQKLADEASKDNRFALDSVDVSQVKEEEIESAVKHPNHHEEYLYKQMEVSSEKDDQNIPDNSERISTTIDDVEAISMAEFLTDIKF